MSAEEIQRLRDRTGSILWRVQEDVAALSTQLREAHRCFSRLADLGEPITTAPHHVEIVTAPVTQEATNGQE